MKKMSLFLLSLFLLPVATLFAGCQGQEEQLSAYQIQLSYDATSHTAQGSVTVEYVNNSSNALQEIMFHLYPNAFSEEGDGLVCSASNESKTYPNGKSFGGIEIFDVQIQAEQAGFELQGEANMLLKVDLPAPLYPDEKTSVAIEFSLTLPNANHRFGYGENTVNFGNFYPIACVYRDGSGFATDPYTSNGDPFFSDCANYTVSITYSSEYKIACSGDSVSTSRNGDQLTTTITAGKVRDFAFVLSDKFQVLSSKADGAVVEYYYYSDNDPQGSLDTAVKAIETYGDLFGSYLYSSFAVVETNFVHGGMEYPRLVMISDQVQGEDYDYVIAHETAHQWWYGVVGNDEFNESWLDESLTEFSTALFFENHPEYNLSYDQIVSGAYSNYNFFLKIYKKIVGEVDTSMLRSLNEFDTEPEYVNNIYTRGIIMLASLRDQIGDRKFFSSLSTYFKEFSFKNATTPDIIAVFEKKCGHKMEGIFNSWLNGEVAFVAQ